MSYSLLSGPTTFWTTADRNLNALVINNDLHMVMMRASVTMRIVLRSTEDLFTNVAPRLAGASICIVNGNFYDVTRAGLVDAYFNSDGVPSAETTPLGRLIRRGRVAGGSAQSQMFYFGQVMMPFVGPQQPPPAPPMPPYPQFFTGFGVAPTHRNGQRVRAGIGGAGPIVVDGLRYGNGNRYRAGSPAATPATGAPPASSRQYLTQRNNNTYRSANALPRNTGKTILAACNARNRVLACVQRHGSGGQTLDWIRDRLFALGFEHAVFLDGSDSSCLWHGGSWRVTPNPDKNETNTVGVAFA